MIMYEHKLLLYIKLAELLVPELNSLEIKLTFLALDVYF